MKRITLATILVALVAGCGSTQQAPQTPEVPTSSVSASPVVELEQHDKPGSALIDQGPLTEQLQALGYELGGGSGPYQTWSRPTVVLQETAEGLKIDSVVQMVQGTVGGFVFDTFACAPIAPLQDLKTIFDRMPERLATALSQPKDLVLAQNGDLHLKAGNSGLDCRLQPAR